MAIETQSHRQSGRHTRPSATSRTRNPATPLQPKSRLRTRPRHFGVTAVIALVFVAWGIADVSSLGTASTSAFGSAEESTGWLFVLLPSGLVVYVIWLAFGRYGRIPLGRDDEEPEFRTLSWVR